MKETQLELSLGNGPGVEVPYHIRLKRLFSEGEPTTLFSDVAKKLAEQSRTGELERLTAHEERYFH